MSSSQDKPDVFMPLYIGDYMAGTSRLTTEQHGAYLLLIMDYWMNGAPPDNDQVLASITRMPLDAWSIARACLEQFFSIEEGTWRHKRIENELSIATAKRKAAKEKAKRAAAARWKKSSGGDGGHGSTSGSAGSSTRGNATSIPTGSACAKHEECPSHSHSESTVITNSTDTPCSPPSCEGGSPRRRRKKSKSPIDPSAEISLAQANRAMSYWRDRGCHDLDAFDEWEKFRAHHLSEGSCKENWDAAWTSWYSKALDFWSQSRMRIPPLPVARAGTIQKNNEAHHESFVSRHTRKDWAEGL